MFDPIEPGDDVKISSIDIAQAYLQSDFFPETDPLRFLKVRNPITGDWRYFWRHGVLYGEFEHTAPVLGVTQFCPRSERTMRFSPCRERDHSAFVC